ncbi:MAG TPA: ArsR family transcriptional regulator [Baekduia sp.]|nr:ArsR family transcriptional regulator [Baekduia sp.]
MDEPVSADVLRALSHPLRLAALVALEAREQTTAELAAHLGVPEPELMHHLVILRGAGLVEDAATRDRMRAAGHGWATIAAHLRRLQDDAAG